MLKKVKTLINSLRGEREMGTVTVNPDLFGATFKGRATITAVVTRADGTVENLGVIAQSAPQPE